MKARKMYVVITAQARGINWPLGPYNNHDDAGERLYGVSHGTLFFTRKRARDEAKIWKGARVVTVNVQPIEDPQ